VALSWIHGFVGSGGDTPPASEAILAMRCICDALQ
jgi:hypothetical protein